MGMETTGETMNCFTGNKHTGELIELYRVSISDLEEEVVRWCAVCGAVVIDLESDGRVYPGRVAKMRFPLTKRIP